MQRQGVHLQLGQPEGDHIGALPGVQAQQRQGIVKPLASLSATQPVRTTTTLDEAYTGVRSTHTLHP